MLSTNYQTKLDKDVLREMRALVQAGMSRATRVESAGAVAHKAASVLSVILNNAQACWDAYTETPGGTATRSYYQDRKADLALKAVTYLTAGFELVATQGRTWLVFQQHQAGSTLVKLEDEERQLMVKVASLLRLADVVVDGLALPLLPVDQLLSEARAAEGNSLRISWAIHIAAVAIGLVEQSTEIRPSNPSGVVLYGQEDRYLAHWYKLRSTLSKLQSRICLEKARLDSERADQAGSRVQPHRRTAAAEGPQPARAWWTQ